MSNKVTFGLTNVHYALATQTEDGSWTFGVPKRLEGAQEISTEVIGSSAQVYADDKDIKTLVSNSGSNVTLKFTEVDEAFKNTTKKAGQVEVNLPKMISIPITKAQEMYNDYYLTKKTKQYIYERLVELDNMYGHDWIEAQEQTILNKIYKMLGGK